MSEIFDLIVAGLVFYFQYVLMWHLLLGTCGAFVVGSIIKRADENLEKESRDYYGSDEVVVWCRTRFLT